MIEGLSRTPILAFPLERLCRNSLFLLVEAVLFTDRSAEIRIALSASRIVLECF